MEIVLENAGKRFNHNWIFRNLTYTFSLPGSYVILGPNGSGKSTLLQLLAGSNLPSEGSVKYFLDKKEVEAGAIYKKVSIAVPYLELIEEFTLEEHLKFHFQFKKTSNDLSIKEIKDLIEIADHGNPIKYFSSGMKQRVKLALALCSKTPLLFLDEPTSNLDAKGIAWYQQLVKHFTNDRITIVCSNQVEHEYHFCNHQIKIDDYKKLQKTLPHTV